jgi:hypothetical protein
MFAKAVRNVATQYNIISSTVETLKVETLNETFCIFTVRETSSSFYLSGIPSFVNFS